MWVKSVPCLRGLLLHVVIGEFIFRVLHVIHRSDPQVVLATLLPLAYIVFVLCIAMGFSTYISLSVTAGFIVLVFTAISKIYRSGLGYMNIEFERGSAMAVLRDGAIYELSEGSLVLRPLTMLSRKHRSRHLEEFSAVKMYGEYIVEHRGKRFKIQIPKCRDYYVLSADPLLADIWFDKVIRIHTPRDILYVTHLAPLRIRLRPIVSTASIVNSNTSAHISVSFNDYANALTIDAHSYRTIRRKVEVILRITTPSAKSYEKVLAKLQGLKRVKVVWKVPILREDLVIVIRRNVPPYQVAKRIIKTMGFREPILIGSNKIKIEVELRELDILRHIKSRSTIPIEVLIRTHSS